MQIIMFQQDLNLSWCHWALTQNFSHGSWLVRLICILGHCAAQPPNEDGHLLRTYDFEILTITPFSKSRFWEEKIFLVQSAAQKWSSLQKMIVSMHWLLWQEMSDFYFYLENDPKGGPFDDIFQFSC